MSMHRFFCENLVQSDTTATLSPEESRHISKVLRLSCGDDIMLLNGKGLTATATIIDLGRRGDEVSCQIKQTLFTPPSLPAIRLYIAPPKGKNMDFLLKAATELGVSRISPIICTFGVSRPDECKEAWRQQLISACKQSRNPWLPSVDMPTPFAAALDKAAEVHFLGAVPREGQPLPNYSKESAIKQGVALWIGPEGGFSQEEEEMLFLHNAIPITIGHWILRVETAVPALLGAIHTLLR